MYVAIDAIEDDGAVEEGADLHPSPTCGCGRSSADVGDTAEVRAAQAGLLRQGVVDVEEWGGGGVAFVGFGGAVSGAGDL